MARIRLDVYRVLNARARIPTDATLRQTSYFYEGHKRSLLKMELQHWQLFEWEKIIFARHVRCAHRRRRRRPVNYRVIIAQPHNWKGNLRVK